MNPKLHIALLNLHYSENLGDGVLSECLIKEIRRIDPNSQVTILDIAGRTSFGEAHSRRRVAITFLSRLPKRWRNLVAEVMFVCFLRPKLLSRWKAGLRNVDVAVIGGGNLFIDEYLNFPLKLSSLARLLEQMNKPYALYGVGATGSLSARGRSLLRSVFRSTALVCRSFRDEESLRHWRTFADLDVRTVSGVCWDPAMLVSSLCPGKKRTTKIRPILGINVISDLDLLQHSSVTVESLDARMAWWKELITSSVEAGYDVQCFTNGDRDDHRRLETISSMFEQKIDSAHVTFRPRPLSPTELTDTISECDIIVGYRLHAHICAYSYGIPSVGFLWDEKVMNFFRRVDRPEFMISLSNSSPCQVVQLITRAYGTGIDIAALERRQREAREEIADLVGKMRATVCHHSLAS